MVARLSAPWREQTREDAGEQAAQKKTADHAPAPLMTGEGQEMAPVMHKFMDVMTGDKRRRALLGPDEIDQEEGENSGECGPRENLAEWDWKRPGCRSMDKASHVLPYRVSHLRAPFGKRRPCESGEDAGKTHPRGGCTVCQRGESLGGAGANQASLV
jgi:hypothetical protein